MEHKLIERLTIWASLSTSTYLYFKLFRPGFFVILQHSVDHGIVLSVDFLPAGVSQVPVDDLPGAFGERNGCREFRHHLFDLTVIEDGAVGFIAKETVADAPAVSGVIAGD